MRQQCWNEIIKIYVPESMGKLQVKIECFYLFSYMPNFYFQVHSSAILSTVQCENRKFNLKIFFPWNNADKVMNFNWKISFFESYKNMKH